MCGLSGIIVTNPSLISLEMAKGLFSLLMEENDDRGGHSWGAWATGVKPIRKLGKFATNRTDLHDHFADLEFRADGPTYLFGHTRFATHGTRTVDNAHPFELGNIVIAHNGVVDVEGYTEADHAVDSGRIAKSIVDHGWVEGMAKVSGSCALLATVNDIPMLYRDNQILSYCIMPWGIAVSSTLTDLDLVIRKKMGLKFDKIHDVPEGAFCQPGFGGVNQPAPTAIRSYVNPNLWKGTSGFNAADYDYLDEREDVFRGWGGGDFGSSSGLKSSGQRELDAIDSKRWQVKTLRPKVEVVDDYTTLYDACSYCGEFKPVEDLYRTEVDYTIGAELFCIDCVTEEIERGYPVLVHGGYGCIPQEGGVHGGGCAIDL